MMTKESLIQEYRMLLAELELGKLDRVAAQVQQWRTLIENYHSLGSFIESLRRLLSSRLALKGGQSQAIVESLLAGLKFEDFFLTGETHFVRGLLCFQSERYAEGAVEFQLAHDAFVKSGDMHKALLSLYNAQGGKANADQMSALDQYEFLVEIEKRALAHECRKILALVVRQKSHLMQDEGRFAAALSFAQEAALIFKLEGTTSDYHLSVLQTADCYLDLERNLEAQGEIEKLMGDLDARVLFARDYVLSRMGKAKFNPTNYRVQPRAWEKKWSKVHKFEQSELTWNSETGKVSGKDLDIMIKKGSKEGELFALLLVNKKSKAMLCEMLWPEQAEVELLQNRLHKLISRINKKHELISFADGHYFVKYKITEI